MKAATSECAPFATFAAEKPIKEGQAATVRSRKKEGRYERARHLHEPRKQHRQLRQSVAVGSRARNLDGGTDAADLRTNN
jgi:hypothetical protein